MIPKAIIFDLDGTLTESKSSLTSEMAHLLARLFRNMSVAIMSGGSYTQFQKQLLNDMPPDANFINLYLFPTSASQCYVWKDGQWISLYNYSFTSEERNKVMRALKESLRETGLDRLPSKLWGEQIEDRGSQITWSALGQLAPTDQKKAWDPNRAKRLPLQKALLKRLPGFAVRANATNSIDITHSGMSKSFGVLQFSEIIHTPISDMLYVGDALFHGGNDEIVKETGISTEQVAGPNDTASIIQKFI